MNSNILYVYCIVLVFLISGCAAERNLVRAINDSNDGNYYASQTKKALDSLSSYKGKNKNILIKDFGNPAEIKTNVYFVGEKYQEQWYYHFSEGVPLVSQNSWACIFYINDDIVKEVSFL